VDGSKLRCQSTVQCVSTRPSQGSQHYPSSCCLAPQILAVLPIFLSFSHHNKPLALISSSARTLLPFLSAASLIIKVSLPSLPQLHTCSSCHLHSSILSCLHLSRLLHLDSLSTLAHSSTSQQIQKIIARLTRLLLSTDIISYRHASLVKIPIHRNGEPSQVRLGERRPRPW